MSPAVYILLLLYWGSDKGSSLTSAEFNSQQTCEVARAAASKAMDGFGMNKTYAVCVPK